MTDVESVRARELVGRAGNHAPPMPDFDLIVAQAHGGAGRDAIPSATLRGRLPVVAALGVFVVAGAALWWAQGPDADQIITGGQGDRAPSVDVAEDSDSSVDSPLASTPATWTTQSWPMLVGVDGLELRSALRGPDADKVMFYTGPDGLQVLIESSAGRDVDFVPGPLAEEIEVNGQPGWMETGGGAGRGSSTSLTWSLDGFQFTLKVEGSLSADEAIEMAEKVVPASEDDLPVAVVSMTGLGTGERFDVATATTNGEQLTLQASSADGFIFFLWLGSRGGSPNIMGLDSPLDVAGQSSSETHPGIAVYGLVDQSVASLSLRLSDGSRQDIEIQSRSLGYDAAFFLAILEDFSAATAIEAYSEDRTLLESSDLSRAALPDPVLAGPLVVTPLQASVEEFVTDTLRWELTEGTIEEIDDGTAFVVTDPDTQSRLRITTRPDGTGISSVAPDNSNWTVAVDISNTSIALSINGLDIDPSSATLHIATRALEIQRTLTEVQIAERSITVDLPRLTDEANLDYLLLLKDGSGHVISAFSPH